MLKQLAAAVGVAGEGGIRVEISSKSRRRHRLFDVMATPRMLGLRVSHDMFLQACFLNFIMVLIMWNSGSVEAANFILGDSLVDTGNNNYLLLSLAKANLHPNGIDLGDGSPTGRFCNGRTVADIIVTSMGAPTPQPYLAPKTRGSVLLDGVNYASGAGGILDSTGYNYVDRLSFNRQLSYFQNTVADLHGMLGVSGATKLLSEAMYFIVFGSNDYINNYLLHNSDTSRHYTPQQYQDLLVSSFQQQLMTLHSLGARKIVVFSVGPLGCLPSQLASSNTNTNGKCIASIDNMCQGFNAAVRTMLNQLQAQLPGVKFSYGDAYNAISQLISNPAQYGFSTTNTGCCGLGPFNGLLACTPASNLCNNRSDHLFWDPFHPTDRANALLADRFWTGGASDISPFNIKELASLM